MNELDSFMNLTELTDDEDLDIASIFGDPSPAQPPPGESAAAPVSYTHLTLPTICSV